MEANSIQKWKVTNHMEEVWKKDKVDFEVEERLKMEEGLSDV